MTHARNFPATLLPLALLLATGCFKLSRETPPLQQFVLSGPVAANANPMPDGLAVGFRRIDVASYLAVPWLVVRRGSNEIMASEYHRWGEDLGEAINRVVAANLAGRPPVRNTDIAPWAPRARHQYLVQLHVARFEGVTDTSAFAPRQADGRVHLRATWDIIRPLDGLVLIRGSSEDRSGTWRVDNYATLVSGLDSALVRLARDIGSCLSRFRNDSTPPVSCSTMSNSDTARLDPPN
ncbi:PqiC family protein [Gemmatimonas sp.]|uniref:PqiC family protein n=1 Tax=Gemmatimonas sp. TaxID=1962908 RepID=UPI003342D604